VLVKTAFDQTKAFINLHKDSIVHELDRSFIDHIYTTQRQLHSLEDYYDGTDDDQSSKINDLKTRLESIEEKYKKNSAGLALLGPIGSAAIVTKEEKLKVQLLTIVNDLSALLHTINHREELFVPAQTISNGLEMNKQLLRELV